MAWAGRPDAGLKRLDEALAAADRIGMRLFSLSMSKATGTGGARRVMLVLSEEGFHMPMFLIERNFAEQLEVTAEAAAAVKRINEEVGVHWLYSYLSADKRKTYCLYEAISPEAIREAAKRAGIPADVIVELNSQIRPEEIA